MQAAPSDEPAAYASMASLPSLAANHRSGNQRQLPPSRPSARMQGVRAPLQAAPRWRLRGVTIQLPSVVCSTLPSELPGQWAAPARAVRALCARSLAVVQQWHPMGVWGVSSERILGFAKVWPAGLCSPPLGCPP